MTSFFLTCDTCGEWTPVATARPRRRRVFCPEHTTHRPSPAAPSGPQLRGLDKRMADLLGARAS